MDISGSKEVVKALRWSMALYVGVPCLTTFVIGVLIGRLW